MDHINYHQFFTHALDVTDNDAIKHSNNQIVKNVILLIDVYEFNEFFADIFEEAIIYDRLSPIEMRDETCNMLINSLKNKSVFSNNTIQELFYHSLIGKSNFWACHKSAFESFLVLSKE